MSFRCNHSEYILNLSFVRCSTVAFDWICPFPSLHFPPLPFPSLPFVSSLKTTEIQCFFGSLLVSSLRLEVHSGWIPPSPTKLRCVCAVVVSCSVTKMPHRRSIWSTHPMGIWSSVCYMGYLVSYKLLHIHKRRTTCDTSGVFPVSREIHWVF